MYDYEKRILALKYQLGLITDVSEDIQNKLSEREELLGLRQRNVQNTAAPTDLDELITHHQKMQDKIADEMLSLAQSLKGQSELANQIIKKDTEILGRSTQLTEKNYEKLKVESEKLEEHSKRAWKCWLWVMLIIVMVVFISKYGF